ncbi:MAG: hypothetical protein ACN6OP_10295 [Pseudomonadales bacterium]
MIWFNARAPMLSETRTPPRWAAWGREQSAIKGGSRPKTDSALSKKVGRSITIYGKPTINIRIFIDAVLVAVRHLFDILKNSIQKDRARLPVDLH